MSVTRPKFVQSRTTTLAAPITDAEVLEVLLTRLVDLYGNQIVMSDFWSTAYLTIEPGTDNEEIISFSDFTVNDDGTISIDTDIVRGIAGVYPYTNVGTPRNHAAGSVVIFSNNPSVYESILAYVEDVAISGAPNASTLVKGIAQTATTAQINAGTLAGSTGANLFVRPDQLAASIYNVQLPSANQKAAFVGTSGTPPTGANPFVDAADVSAAGAADKIVRAVGTSLPAMDGSLLTSVFQLYGDGSDGAVVISGNTTLTKDTFYTNLTINAGITLNAGGYRIYGNGTLTNNGTISNAASGATPGASGTLAGGAPGGTSLTGAVISGFGGAGGGVVWIAFKTVAVQGTITAVGGQGGNASNPGGGAVNGNGNTGSSISKTLIQTGTAGAGGNSSGNTGGIAGTLSASKMSTHNVFIMSAFYDFLAGLPLAGGVGAGSGAATSGSSNAGGGGGGQGGVIFFMYHTLVTPGTLNVAGGTFGTGIGVGGVNGTAGAAGLAISLVV